METERFVLDHAFVKLESACLKSFAASRVAAVKNRNIVYFSHRVYRAEKAREILFGIDIFLSVRRKKDIFSFFEAEFFVDIRSFDLFQIVVENFSHRRARNIGAFLRKSAVGEVTSRVLRICDIYV